MACYAFGVASKQGNRARQQATKARPQGSAKDSGQEGTKMDTVIKQETMEYKIKELLAAKLEAGEMDFLHGFYRIPGVYRYSMRNSMLIMIQGGSIAMGFDRWLKLGRHVKRGERSTIDILVPKIIPAGKVTPGAAVAQDSDADGTRCAGFFSRKVFDIKQTEGKELVYENNSAEVIDCQFDTVSVQLAAALKISISTAITGSGRGYYSDHDKKIVISSMSNNADKCKTMFHELGHYLLGHDQGGQVPSQEVEAELVSLLTCSALGVEFKESPLYIKAYNTNKPDVRVLKVISAVQKILKALEPAASEALALQEAV